MDSQETKFDENGNEIVATEAPVVPATPVAPTEPVVETTPVAPVAPVAEVKAEEVKPAPELTEQQKADAALEARVELLKETIKKVVAALLVEDYTIQELGYAPDLFKTWLKIQTAQTVQHETLVKTVQEANKLFGDLKSKDLTRIPDVQDSKETKA